MKTIMVSLVCVSCLSLIAQEKPYPEPLPTAPTGAPFALEGTRDWGAFAMLSADVNAWLKEVKDKGKDAEGVATTNISIQFFQFWLMYYGPLAYTDEETVAIKPYL